ncbi:helix-turn-helix transcriptional regulator [Spongiactinospora sp. TRM90649]|uniref:helix-turn-helix domain-containing protein n=1 Tax=Spongiactinospora sp. TRM90649 TaxID=3031114 RepID=UPI0023F7B2B4|nr:helix-turn-helix transcriptional regulator [Spongiactinospora sp. TRM90649]MDF5753859.1 helix-turn-helix transcriptional regulator [Spongiactinospora sp. TRM90649]
MLTESQLMAIKQFGLELRRFRKEARLSQARLAGPLGCGQSLVGHFERGTRTPQREHAEAADRFFDSSPQFFKLWKRIHYAPGGPQWYARWLEEIEPNAEILRSWDPILIPGLLQTEEYARFVIANDETPPNLVEDRVRARLARQTILDRERPPEVWVMIDETALHRLIGTRATMRHQLDHLIAAAEQPGMTIQVVPRDSGTTAGLSSSFILAESHGVPTTVSIESAGLGEVSADVDLVSLVCRRYDRLRAEALRPRDSSRMIEEVRGKWNE